MNRILFKRFLVFLTVILTVAVMTFAFTACSFGATDGGKDNTSDVTDDDKDNTGEVTDDGNGDVDAGGNEGGNEEGGADGDETTPEEPENPEEPVEPVDPEEPEPEPEPTPEPEPDPSDEPQDITEVDEIDEINKFGDKAIKILKDNYLDGIALKVIGKGMTAENIDSAEWLITKSNGNTIKELQVKVYYYSGDIKLFKVGKVEFNEDYNVSEILSGKAQNVTYSKIYQGPQISKENIEANKELGNLVINVVNGTDTTTQNEGDIWCSIGGNIPSQGKYVTQITVYQIIETGVYKYQLTIRTPDSTVTPADFIENINDNYGAEKETVFTFTGIVIE